MGSLLNGFNLSVKSKTKFKSKSIYSERSKAVANVRFLVRHEHLDKGLSDYSVISTEGNSFRVLDEDDDDDDDDLPRNLLSLLRNQKLGIYPSYGVLGCCGSWTWLLFQRFPFIPEYLLWDMERDSRSLCLRSTFPCLNGYVWACGFGFDPSSGHYKLVSCWVGDAEERYAEVFSLGTCSWKAVHYPFDFTVSPETYSSVHINGLYYWIVGARAGFDESFTIMLFDFANDQFRALIPLPKKENCRKLVRVALVEFQGSLAVICCVLEDRPFIFEIWAWNARGSFWSIVSTFDIPAAAAPRKVRNLYKNDKLIIEDSKGDLLLYDHATRQLENLGLPIDRRGYSEFFPYVKSSVGHGSSG